MKLTENIKEIDSLTQLIPTLTRILFVVRIGVNFFNVFCEFYPGRDPDWVSGTGHSFKKFS